MKRILSAALAMALVMAGGAAEAKRDGHGGGERNGRGGYEGRDRGDRDRGARDRGDRRERSRGEDGPRRWERGERVPGAYRGGVIDYRDQRLRRPPRGYQWVRVGGDMLLMDVSTGLVLEVIPGR